MIGQVEDGAETQSLLSVLYTQLRFLVPVLTVSPEGAESTQMVAGLQDTANRATGLLTSTEPGALTAIGRALDHVRAGRYSQACSELLNARSLLAVRLRQNAPAFAELASPRGFTVDLPVVEAP